MRRRLASALVSIALSVPTSALAEGRRCDERPGALVADLGLHVVNVGYDRSLGCAVSVQVSAGLYVPWFVNEDLFGLGGGDAREVRGTVLRARLFLHPEDAGRPGFWVSPFVQGGVVMAPRGAERVTGVAVAVGMSAGYTWALSSRWLLSLGGGAQVHAALFDGRSAWPGFAGVAPHVDINVDYAL